MSIVDVTIPAVGESISEASIGKLFVQDGQWVEKGTPVFEIETDKATMEVSAPASGQVDLIAKSGDLLPIGSVVGRIDTAKHKAAGNGAVKVSPQKSAKSEKSEKSKKSEKLDKPEAPKPTGSSPVVSPVPTTGIGPAQRKAIREGKMTLTQSPSPSTGAVTPIVGWPPVDQEIQRKPMSVLRKKIAERLWSSQHNTATLTTFNEVDMTQLLKTREQLKLEFQNRFGVKLGFMSYFVKAVVFGIQNVPSVNAFLEGSEIIYHKNVHISIAVSTERGLLVPVLRYCNQLSFSQIEKGILDLADRARAGQLGIEEMMGGTFTVTNGGVFGSLLSTPILNPPQSGILGMHKIEHRPIAIEKTPGHFEVAARPMMYVALSYDHRLIDGRESVTFLVKVKEFLESITTEKILET